MEISEEAVVVNSSRLKSIVWNDFDRVKKGETFAAICRHCKRILSGSSTSGTSHLRNHLIRCRRRSNHDVSQLLTRGKKKQSTHALANFAHNQSMVKNELVTVASTNFEEGLKVGNINMGNLNFDCRRSQLDLARMIIMHRYRLGIVDDIGFKTFVRNLQPFFDLMTVSGVEASCIEIYEREKQRVNEELDKLPGKVSLSVDRWATNEGVEYLGLVAHYIDDSWELKKKNLNFLVIDPSQAEESLSDLIMTSLRSWDIDRKLFSLTIDNCSTYDKVVSRIRDQLCQHRFLMCEGQLFDVRCAASTVKLLVQEVLETSREMTKKVREIIQYVKGSQATQDKFNNTVRVNGINAQKGLSVDNPFKWNSTYVMLEAALEYKEVFPQLEHEPEFSSCPSGIDWDRLRAITSILKFFYEVSNVFVGSKHITANSFFAEICDIHLQLIEWCQKSDDFISSLALKLKSNFDEYWKKCSLIMAVAAILDPRFKMKLVEYYYPQIYGDSAPDCIGIVSNCMKALYSGHTIYSPLAVDGQSLGADNGIAGKDRLTGFDRYLHETSVSQNIKSDLDKYLEEPLFPRSAEFNILNWWRVHEPRYPVLSMMARNILGIPISKVSSESVFETGNRALDDSWSSLKSETLQALMCSQDWLRNELEAPDSRSPATPIFALRYDSS